MNVMRSWKPKKGDKRSIRLERWHRERKGTVALLNEAIPPSGRRRKRR